MGQLILLRHGQSEWNRKGLFTGWMDVSLSHKGVEEALSARKELTAFPIGYVFTSELIRAQTTAFLALIDHPTGRVPCVQHPDEKGLGFDLYPKEMAAELMPVYIARELNERMYGALQGRSKREVEEEFGSSQFKKWRRGFRDAPPQGESLAMTASRVLPYFHQRILPHVVAGESVLVCAHGNSLRALVMQIEGLSEEAVTGLEIPTGKPKVYRWAASQWQRGS